MAQNRLYLGENVARRGEIYGFPYDAERAVKSGGETGEEGLKCFSCQSLDAVTIDGARGNLLANDHSETISPKGIRQKSKRKKASICLSPHTKHPTYFVTIGQSVRSWQHTNMKRNMRKVTQE